MSDSKKPRQLQGQIINIIPDPVNKGRMIVSCRFDDGNKKLGSWTQGFSIDPEKYGEPIEFDDFIENLEDKEIQRDPFLKLREAMEKKKTFKIFMKPE